MDEAELVRVRANVAKSSTEDLLDRVTVYRDGMEPDALDLIEAELRRRGIGVETITAHEAGRRATMKTDADGQPRLCHACRRPAVVVRWVWFRAWGLLPLFPLRAGFCAEHAANATW